MIVIAAVVGGYILAHENLKLPGWVPVLGRNYYTLKADFQTAQAVTPGQGQAVTIAGAKIGEIASVDLQRRGRDGDDENDPEVRAHLPQRDAAAAPEDQLAGHHRRGQPGHALGRAAAQRRSRSPSRRPPRTSTSTNSSPRWTRKRAPTCRSCWPARAKDSTTTARPSSATLKRFDPTARRRPGNRRSSSKSATRTSRARSTTSAC